jgi:serine/threonine protein kinase/Flp pilus assembly protein TadD
MFSPPLSAPDSSTPSTQHMRPRPNSGRWDLLAGQLASAMADDWRAGQQKPAEEYLERHAELKDHAEAVLRLVCEEICLREEAGLPLPPSQFLERFPRFRAELQALLDCHQILEESLEGAQVPQAATALEDFHILDQLGKGGQGRVVLAKQLSLGDRPVVLKISTRRGQEHLSLARMQHTHIVPLYWMKDEPENDRRILCMPYFGTVTLSGLIAALKDKPPPERTGADLLTVLDQARASATVALPGQGPARLFLQRASFPEAVCWIGACLADALEYAHERGLVHLDLKPSNVLLTFDGQPMLLDFHLAREPLSASKPAVVGIGGTPLYMSPEQKAVVDAIAQGREFQAAVDGRSDLYSLGLILYQALGGQVPLPHPLPRVEQVNPQVSPGLADIIHKLLEPRPEDRYPDAAALAADFRRHLAHRPLKGVANRSWRERWVKWRRRSPHALALYCVVALSLMGALIAAVGLRGHQQAELRERQQRVQKAWDVGQEHFLRGRYGEAANELASGLELARTTAGSGELAEQLATRLEDARRRHALHELHTLTDRIRFAAGTPTSLRGLPELEKACRSLWEARARLSKIRAGESDSAIAQQARHDLLDLAVLWVNLRLRLATPDDRDDVRRDGLETLVRAEQLLGASPALYHERQGLLRALGQAGPVSEPPPAETAWDHYALGRSLLETGDFAQAEARFRRALALDPQHFWANFYHGLCAFRQEQYHDAESSFRACFTLNPKAAYAYFNHGQALFKLGRLERALEDFTQALILDPGLAEAAFSRGVLHLKEKRFDQAQRDFDQALNKGNDPAPTYYNLALVYQAQDNHREALRHAEEALRRRPDFPEAQALSDRLRKK